MVLQKIRENPNNEFDDEDMLKNKNKKTSKGCCK